MYDWQSDEPQQIFYKIGLQTLQTGYVIIEGFTKRSSYTFPRCVSVNPIAFKNDWAFLNCKNKIITVLLQCMYFNPTHQ